MDALHSFPHPPILEEVNLCLKLSALRFEWFLESKDRQKIMRQISYPVCLVHLKQLGGLQQL